MNAVENQYRVKPNPKGVSFDSPFNFSSDASSGLKNRGKGRQTNQFNSLVNPINHETARGTALISSTAEVMRNNNGRGSLKNNSGYTEKPNNIRINERVAYPVTESNYRRSSQEKQVDSKAQFMKNMEAFYDQVDGEMLDCY